MSSTQRPPAPPLAIAACLLFSEEPDALAAFYIDKLGVPLKRMVMPDVPQHWACEIGSVYFSIWPPATNDALPPGGRSAVAFYVRNLQIVFEKLAAEGVDVIFAPKKTPMGIIARLKDPQGNAFELYTTIS
jgi:predicted enzyme related to lactoylglutathione lyase